MNRVIVDQDWGSSKLKVIEDSNIDVLSHSLPYVKHTNVRPDSRNIQKEDLHKSMENISKYIRVSSQDRMVRPAVDVLATYINTSDKRVVKADLLRAQARFVGRKIPNSKEEEKMEERGRKGSLGRKVSLASNSREASGEWGWFADIDSSGDSYSGELLPSMRRLYSMEKKGEDEEIVDEANNTRITAAHKTFAWSEEDTLLVDTHIQSNTILSRVSPKSGAKVVCAAISMPKFRIVQSKSGADRHAEYQVTLKLGNTFYSDWRRYSEFQNVLKHAQPECYARTHIAWKNIDTRWFNRLEPSYLHKKCIALEGFIREFMYESNDPALLLHFLGGSAGKVNTRPMEAVETVVHESNSQIDYSELRPSAQLPKDLRPQQPAQERELFEKLWAENFKRSMIPSPSTERRFASE